MRKFKGIAKHNFVLYQRNVSGDLITVVFNRKKGIMNTRLQWRCV